MQSGLAAWRRNPFPILVLLRPRNNPQVTNYLSPPSVFPTVSKGVDETLVTAPPALTLDSTKCQVLPQSSVALLPVSRSWGTACSRDADVRPTSQPRSSRSRSLYSRRGLCTGLVRDCAPRCCVQLQQFQGRERGLNPARVFGLRLLPKHLQGLTCLSWHLVSPTPGSVQPRAGVRKRASQLSGSQLPPHI